eukprot:TRINITY_DN12682_c0_g2_i5.p1 TRINITY_DN12682_c0_g2~~TRINITY_DN12682_c0_g2_i5.p1  ORF type:complete len:3456 (+),score=703.92 TRINITY_DN12682_c0_g2_i5:578-10369(+)
MDGTLVGREFGKLRSSASSLSQAGSQTFMTQQPKLARVAAELVDVVNVDSFAGALSVGHFRVVLQPGGEEKQWLRSGHAVDVFFRPLAAWDLTATVPGVSTGCNSLVLAIPNLLRSFVAPSCSSYSVGEGAVDNRHNAFRLVLGSETVINPFATGVLEFYLMLPTGGLLDTRIVVATRHQDQVGQAAWHEEAEEATSWAPRASAAYFVGAPVVAESANLTVELVITSGLTLLGSVRPRVRILPPADFRVVEAVAPPENALQPALRLDASRSGRIAGSFATEWGQAYDVVLQETSAVYAGAEYLLRLVILALSPSAGLRSSWSLQILSGLATGEAGPKVLLHAGAGQSAGVLVPGALRASLSMSSLHASALTSITVYFMPAQTQGIFFRYLVLTAPLGTDFSEALAGVDPSVGGTGSEICLVSAKLNLAPHIQCRASKAGEYSRTQDVATVVLPPLSRLQPLAYGFSVQAILPTYSMAWVEEASGRGNFMMETWTEDFAQADVLHALPGSDPGPSEPVTPPPFLYPRSCSSAVVRLQGLAPEQVSRVTLLLRAGQEQRPSVTALYIYVHAPGGFRWTFQDAAWSSSVSRGGNPAVTLPISDFGPVVMPDGTCLPSRTNILCIRSTSSVKASDIFTMVAAIRVPTMNPDVPQGDALPSPMSWRVEIGQAPAASDGIVPPGDRWLVCAATFEPPNRVQRIFSAAAAPTNAVVGAENDVTLAITTVTEVPQGGAMVIVAPLGAVSFPYPCEVVETPSGSVSTSGLPIPQSAGAVCQSDPDKPNAAAVVLQLGALPANAYLFTVLSLQNIQAHQANDERFQWKVYTVANGTKAVEDVGTNRVTYLDSPIDFSAFSVLAAMSDAFIDTQLLDPDVARFTKGRSRQNEVVICFRQSSATPAGQTLMVRIPEGFRLPWRDSNDCTLPDPGSGVPPVEIADPFGVGDRMDTDRFTTFPEGTQVSCAVSPDGGSALLTLSQGLVEISRYYAFRLVVQNADRSPEINVWRLQFGQQASKPIAGFTMQAFQQLRLVASVTGAAQLVGEAPPNLLQVSFQPSVPVPAGGALQLTPPRGFELVRSVPRTSRGLLVKAEARCVGEAVFLGVDYSFEQCEAACSQRSDCEYFRVGIGDRSGECIQESSIDDGPPCQEFISSRTSSVYRVTPTGNCYRFQMLEDDKLRDNVDCSLVEMPTASLPGQGLVTDETLMTTVAVFSIAVNAPSMSVDKLFQATIAVHNPLEMPEQSLWSLQSFSQVSLAAEALLEDGAADGFPLVTGLDRLEFFALPFELKHKAGMSIELSFRWAPKELVLSGLDVIEVNFPPWLGVPVNVCDTLVPEQPAAQYALTDCRTLAGSMGLRFSVDGPPEVLDKGRRLDFRFRAQNPDASVVATLPRGELSLVSLSHLRPVVSAVTGETLLLAVASSAATAHAVQLALPSLSLRQALPQFPVAGHFPTTLEVSFVVTSPRADQVWIDTAASGNAMDFSQVQCTMAIEEGTDQQVNMAELSTALFGQISCESAGLMEVETAGARIMQKTQLRVDSTTTFLPGQRYTLKLEGVRVGLLPGYVEATVATSTASSSADSKDFGQAFLLDRSLLSEAGGDDGVWLAGRLILSPLGAGSFTSLSSSAAFGTTTFAAADYIHFLTLAFSLQVPISPPDDRLILYPADTVQALASGVVLGLAAARATFSTKLRSIANGQDDVFSSCAQLGLPRPRYKQRLDVSFLASPPSSPAPFIQVPAGQPVSLRLSIQAPLTGSSSNNGWLLLTSSKAAWFGQANVISNTNQEEWSGGQLEIVPAFDPRGTMVRTSSSKSSAVVSVTVVLAPATNVPKGSTLRISAPKLFVWLADCVTATSPKSLVLIGSKQCWRDSTEPHAVLLPLNLAMQARAAHELLMRALTPPALEPPNRWEVAVLQLPQLQQATVQDAGASSAGSPASDGSIDDGVVEAPDFMEARYEGSVTDPRELHHGVVPLQVVRLPGFDLTGLEARLEPLRAFAGGEGMQQLLLSFRLLEVALEGEELRLAVMPLRFRLRAPYPVVVSCPPPEVLRGGEAHETRSSSEEEPIEYVEDGKVEGSWQLLALEQRPAGLKRCTPAGWRATNTSGGRDVTKGSSVFLELDVPLRPGNPDSEDKGEWLAMPILARLGVTEQEELQLLAVPNRFWALELLSAEKGEPLAATAVVRTSPQVLLAHSIPAGVPLNRLEDVFACGAGQFCAAVSGAPEEVPSAAMLQLDRGGGVRINLALSLPSLVPAWGGLAGRRFETAFDHGAVGAAGTPFPAEMALGSFIQLTVPKPLQWTRGCSVVNTTELSSAVWSCVCFGNAAFVFVAGYSSAASTPLQEVLTIQGVTLRDPLDPDKALRLPKSTTWVASLYNAGQLVAQQLLESHEEEAIDRVPDVHIDESASALLRDENASGVEAGSAADDTDTHAEIPEGFVELETDSIDLEGCGSQTFQFYPCPEGMYAYGFRAVRLGGTDSWLDSLQLLCRLELDVGTNHTLWAVQSSTSGLAGDKQLLTRSQDEAASIQVDNLECDAKASSLLVGGRMEVWRKRRMLGVTAACSPWVQVERAIPWDRGGGEELEPLRTAGTEIKTSANCSGAAPIVGSDLWAHCQGIEDLRPCPGNPDECCCNVDFEYNPVLKSCEPCSGSKDSSTAQSEMRLCPPGMAVAGFHAGLVEASKGGTSQAFGSDIAAATVCSIRLVCRDLRVRNFAGNTASTKDLVEADWEEPVEETTGLGLPGIGGFQIEIWQYAVAGGVLLLLLFLFYYYCCRSSEADMVFGDTLVGERRGVLMTIIRVVTVPIGLLWRLLVKPAANLLWRFFFGPLWRICLKPILDRVRQTRAYKAVAERMWNFARRVGRCLMFVFPCLRRFENLPAKEILALLNPLTMPGNIKDWAIDQLEARKEKALMALSPRSLTTKLEAMVASGAITEKEMKLKLKEQQALTLGGGLKEKKKKMTTRARIRAAWKTLRNLKMSDVGRALTRKNVKTQCSRFGRWCCRCRLLKRCLGPCLRLCINKRCFNRLCSKTCRMRLKRVVCIFPCCRRFRDSPEEEAQKDAEPDDEGEDDWWDDDEEEWDFEEGEEEAVLARDPEVDPDDPSRVDLSAQASARAPATSSRKSQKERKKVQFGEVKEQQIEARGQQLPKKAKEASATEAPQEAQASREVEGAAEETKAPGQEGSTEEQRKEGQKSKAEPKKRLSKVGKKAKQEGSIEDKTAKSSGAETAEEGAEKVSAAEAATPGGEESEEKGPEGQRKVDPSAKKQGQTEKKESAEKKQKK